MTKPISKVLRRFSEHIEEIDSLLHLSVVGISREEKSVELVRALSDYDSTYGEKLPAEEYSKRISRAEIHAKFARSQIKAGFPILFAHSVIAMWSALETMIEDIVFAILKDNQSALQAENIKKIKIPLVEYELLDKEERLRFIIGELARQTNAELRQGVTKFEVLLESVSLSGPLKDELRKTIFELWAVRNLLVHRFGIVDRRFTELCPWLGTKIGEQFKIKTDYYHRYRSAVTDYAVELIIREMVREGSTREEAEKRINTNKKGENESIDTA